MEQLGTCSDYLDLGLKSGGYYENFSAHNMNTIGLFETEVEPCRPKPIPFSKNSESGIIICFHYIYDFDKQRLAIINIFSFLK